MKSFSFIRNELFSHHKHGWNVSLSLNFSLEIAEYNNSYTSGKFAVRLFFSFSIFCCWFSFVYICFELISIPALSAIYFNSFEEYNWLFRSHSLSLLLSFSRCSCVRVSVFIACAFDICAINAYCVCNSVYSHSPPRPCTYATGSTESR